MEMQFHNSASVPSPQGRNSSAAPAASLARSQRIGLSHVPALAGVMLIGLLITACGSPRAASGSQAQVAIRPYPLDTCLVTENALGSMGDPVTLVHAGQEIKLCCAPCVEEFKAHPETYLSRLE